MNPRNLLLVNSHFFGVLVRTTGIRAWQAGHLLRGARFSPQEKSELSPRPPPPLLHPLASIPCSDKRHYLSNLPPPHRWLPTGGGGRSRWGPCCPPSWLLLALGAQGCPLLTPAGPGGCTMGRGENGFRVPGPACSSLSTQVHTLSGVHGVG